MNSIAIYDAINNFRNHKDSKINRFELNQHRKLEISSIITQEFNKQKLEYEKELLNTRYSNELIYLVLSAKERNLDLSIVEKLINQNKTFLATLSMLPDHFSCLFYLYHNHKNQPLPILDRDICRRMHWKCFLF
jgi:hypothetical protein